MGMKPSDFKRLQTMMAAVLPLGAPRFDEVDEATDWILNVTDPLHFTRVAFLDDKALMKHFVWHMSRFPGTNRMCTIQGIPAWVGAGLPTKEQEYAAQD